MSSSKSKMCTSRSGSLPSTVGRTPMLATPRRSSPSPVTVTANTPFRAAR